MPRINQIVGRLIQVAAIASIPSCFGLVSEMDPSQAQFYIGEDAPKEYKALISKSDRVYEMSRFPGLADHTGPEDLRNIIIENAVREKKGLSKLPMPKESKLTGGADYCRVQDSFHGGERRVDCYAVIKNKIEKRWFAEYLCKAPGSMSDCDVRISGDQRFVVDYQQATDISQEISADSEREIFTLVAMVMSFTSPLWLFLGGWIAKNKRKDSQAPEG